MPQTTPHDDRAGEREEMARRHLAARGIRDPRVLGAMRRVPRERFLPPRLAGEAYADHPLPIAGGQTISQPYIVALTAEAGRLGPDDRVLDVGTGSGYAAAVYAELAGEVWSVERIPALAETAREALGAAGYGRVRVVTDDGTLGLPEHAPYDAILAAAAGPEVPEPWIEQLADGGRIVMPVEREAGWQQLVRITRDGDIVREEALGAVRFVPLYGEHGFPHR